MIPLLLSALASAAAPAGETRSDQWLNLDRQIESLASTLTAPDNGIKVSAWIKTNYIYQDKNGAPDTSGFQLNSLRMTFSGDVTDKVKLKVSIDGAKGTVELKDGFAQVKLAEPVQLTFGQYRAPILQSSSASDDKLLFYERSAQGNVWKEREPGAMFEGKIQKLRWYASAQNGGDGTEEELLLIGHLAYDVAGPGIIKQEAGYGPDAPSMLTLGATYLDEGSISDGRALFFEVLAAKGPIYFQGEVADYDSGYTAGAITQGVAKSASGLADTTPYDLTLSYMFNSNWEAALRYQDADDTDDTSTIGAGVNYYVKGHECKWQLNWLTTDSQSASLDSDKLLLGLVLAI